MTTRELGIVDALVISLPGGEDERGKGIEFFRQDRVSDALGYEFTPVQIALLQNNRGALRGLHLASGVRQGKLITCVTGRIWDVLVDLRPVSPTRGHYAAVELSGARSESVYCPPGVAHGFVTLNPDSIVTLTVDVPFADVAERSIDAFDPDLAIPWPLVEEECIRSERDQSAPPLSQMGAF